MISLIRLRNSQKNRPASYLHIHTSIKMKAKHDLSGRIFSLLSPKLYSKQTRFKRCVLYTHMKSNSHFYTGLFPG